MTSSLYFVNYSIAQVFSILLHFTIFSFLTYFFLTLKRFFISFLLVLPQYKIYIYTHKFICFSYHPKCICLLSIPCTECELNLLVSVSFCIQCAFCTYVFKSVCAFILRVCLYKFATGIYFQNVFF